MIDRDRQAAVYALRQARQGIDVALSMLDAEEQSGECKHPQDKRQELGGFGGNPGHFYCTACRTEVRNGKPVPKAGQATEVPSAD